MYCRCVWKCELSTTSTAYAAARGSSRGRELLRSPQPAKNAKSAISRMARTWRAHRQWAQAGAAAVSHGMETWPRQRIFERSVDWLQRGAPAIHPRSGGSAHLPFTLRKPRSLGRRFSVGRSSWVRYSVRRAAFHSSASPGVRLDLRGIQDQHMRAKGSHYFENKTGLPTLVQQQYAIENPQKFARYSEHCWGTSPATMARAR